MHRHLFRLSTERERLKIATADPPLELKWFTDLAVPGDTLAKQPSLQDTVDISLSTAQVLQHRTRGERRAAVDEVNRL